MAYYEAYNYPYDLTEDTRQQKLLNVLNIKLGTKIKNIHREVTRRYDDFNANTMYGNNYYNLEANIHYNIKYTYSIDFPHGAIDKMVESLEISSRYKKEMEIVANDSTLTQLYNEYRAMLLLRYDLTERS